MSRAATPKQLGKRIREARGSRKVEALIEGTSIPRESWSRYENGTGGWMKVNTLLEVAKALDVPAASLVGDGEISPPTAPPSEDLEEAAQTAETLAARLRSMAHSRSRIAPGKKVVGWKHLAFGPEIDEEIDQLGTDAPKIKELIKVLRSMPLDIWEKGKRTG